jgi:hypothetical protein
MERIGEKKALRLPLMLVLVCIIQDVFRISIKLSILLMCVSINQNKIKAFLLGKAKGDVVKTIK